MTDTTSAAPSLLPCPFCGYDTPEFERLGTPSQSCIVACGNCGARHESGDEYWASGTSWNRRAQPAPPAFAPSGYVLVPVEVANLYDFMHTAFTPMTSQHEQIAISLDLARKACGSRHIAAVAATPPHGLPT